MKKKHKRTSQKALLLEQQTSSMSTARGKPPRKTPKQLRKASKKQLARSAPKSASKMKPEVQKTKVLESAKAQPETASLAAPTSRKVPEALPLKNERDRTNAVSRLTARVFKKPAIQEVVREPTAGGIVFRTNREQNDIDILLIQDSKGRWTIPKGHIEPGETAKQTAIREIGEESGLFHIQVLAWLGKIHFQYRRIDKLVLMTTQIYLVRAMDDAETPTKEQWMKGIKWFKFNDAIEAIEYEDIEKLMLVARNKIRQGL